MNTQTIRQQLIQEIAELPSEALLELRQFIDYLRYKSSQKPSISESRTINKDTEVSSTPDRPFYDTATSEEWTRAFLEWTESHRSMNYPLVSDEAISRESIYGERG